MEENHRARFIRSWIGTERGENGKTRVTFVWEPLPPVPGRDRNQATAVSIVATGSGDRPYFRGRVPAAAAAAGQTADARPAAAAPAAEAAPATREPGRPHLGMTTRSRGRTSLRRLATPHALAVWARWAHFERRGSPPA
jgi:pyruvate/2-oxoglutarate dehydrogenase complex dihydrolipoamide acyltransferase (E2) component